MTVEQKNEKSRKRREVSQRNKGLTIQPEASRGDEKVSLSDGCSTIDFTNFATQVPNVNQDDDSDWLHRNETFKADNVFTTRDLLTPSGVHENVGNTPNHNLGRAAYSRERYKNLTPVEREFRRERLRLYNNTPKRKGSKIEYIRKRRALLADTLSQESIAMESPTYTTEVVHPTTDTIEPDGSAVTPCDWVIPDIASNPFLPASTQTEDADSLFDDDDSVVFEDDVDENKGYLFARQYEDTDEDIEIDGSQDESTATDVHDPYDKVYSNIPEETHMLKTVPNCGYCTAKKFEYETPGFCCRGGKVELAPLETPPQLKRLWDSADSDARHFPNNIRFFNGHFSFTSLYCCLNSMTTNVRDSGIYTFRAQGMMYHNIKSFGREGGAEHKHLELYFYDDDPTLEHRYRKCREEHQLKDKEVIRQIVDILRGNPYSEHLRTMGHVDNLDDYRIALNLDQTLNQKTYNTPLTSEVAAVWIEGSEGRGQFSKSVMLHGKDSSSHCIRSYHVCYDALSYPLFFPKGKLGWHANIPKVGVSMDEVDAYRATHRASNANDEDAESPSHLCVSIRPGVFNPILHGKRLFQQFAVDTYIKIESSRLDYIRRNQDRLRADLYQDLVDSMLDGDIRAEKVDKRTVLSTSFIGGPRDMRRRYMDAMALRKYKLTCPEQYDLLISAEIPSNKYPELRKMACGSIKAIKYLFKYIYKGHDRASVVMRDASKADDDVDEIKQYRDARWVTPPEALWRIYGFELSQISPPVMQLQLHLPNMHMVAFHDRQMVERVVNCPGVDRSMLTSYFEANRLHDEARCILYRDFPEWYTWQSGKGKKHKDSMSKDYEHKSQNKTHVEQMSMGKDIKTFPLPPIIDTYDDAIGTAREVYEEETIESTAGDVALKDSLNKEQRAAYDKIMSAVDTDQGGLFFVDGPGGTGKTYLYRVLLTTLRNQGKIAVAIAASGVAASIMPGGRTAHSRFKIPLTIDDGAVCSFTKQSGTAELLRKASLIIWDEASMTKRQAVEALDNSMCDIMGRPALPFGGKTIVFGGDFRQVLPVVRKGSRAQVVASSLRMSYLWESMSHLNLVSNMRAKNDPWFAEFLLRVGGGTEDTNSDGDIRLPDNVCVPYSGSDSDLDNLIDFAFPNLNKNMSDSTYITSRAILSTRNDWVDMINVKMIDRFQGEHMVYHSFDSAMDDPHNYYPPEFLNTLTPNGLPPHVLKLKIGCPVILL
ncbi:hypothetical protein Zm00014a_034232 [Zea mays]|uniref:ATP-dependent DNA helicase n=1 Tax=Zea mays TaxID=4577 RepID=A0A3L6E6A5_MAIZE|nr:hypothetical protein Zm00014a_034232 [Zea mays]